MKKKKLFAIIMSMLMIACFMPSMAFAEDTWSGGEFTFNGMNYSASSNGTDAILNGPVTVPSGGSITVPETVTDSNNKSYTVKEIRGGAGGWSAFYNSTGLTSVTLPDSITEIPDSAFSKCTSLTSVTLGNNVTSIGEAAFSGCTALTSLTLPDTLTSIEAVAFKNCTALANLTLPETLTSIGAGAFENCTALAELAIPASVTEGDAGLLGFTNLEKVKFAAGSKFKLNEKVLYYGSKLIVVLDRYIESCTVLDGTTEISNTAFRTSDNRSACESLTSVTLPASLRTISAGTFGRSDSKAATCRSLNTVTFAGGTPSLETIEAEAFANTALSSINLPDTLTTIGELAFQGTKLSSVVIPARVTEIPKGAFSKVNLKTVVLCGNVTSVGMNAFSGWKSGANDCTLVMTGETAPKFDAKAFGVNSSKGASPTGLTVLVPSTAKKDYASALSGFSGIAINTFGPSVTDLTVKATEGSNTATLTAEVPTGCTLTVNSADDSIATAKVDENNKITITGVKAGKTTITAAIELTDRAYTLTNTINVTVLADDKEPAVVVSADTAAKVNEEMDDEVKETAENIAKALQPSASAEENAKSEGLTVEKTVLNSAAHEVLEENTVSAADGKTALEDAGVTGINDATVSIVVQPYLDVTVKNVETTGTGESGSATTITTLTLDITPMFKKVATTADVKSSTNNEIVLEGEGKNAVELEDQGGKLNITESTEVKVPLPEGVLTEEQPAYIVHTKDNGRSYVYTGSVKNNVLTFTSEHGFSTFTISQENPTAAKMGDTSYPTLQDALDDADNNAEIELMKDGLSGNLTTTKTVALKNGTQSEITVTVNGKEYKIANDETQNVSYTKSSGGRGGYVAPTTDDTKTDDTAADTKTDEQIQAENAAKAASLTKALTLKARSVKTAKGNIKVTLTVDGDAIKAIEDLGYTVKYKFYRSTKKAASYKAALENTGKTYTNTNGKKGTKYYYKARVMVYDAQGKLIAKSALTQCKYACRKF